MKVLVTGATGGLGLNLVPYLLKKNIQVVATGRNKKAGEILSSLGAQFIAGNLEDQEIMNLCKGTEIVFHCGALASPWGKYQDFYKTNVIGTQNIVAGCLKHKVSRLIHISTPSIYFDFTEKFNIKENAPLPSLPANHYIATKLEAERIVDNAFKKEGLPVITIRPRAIFGPYDDAIMPGIIRAARKRKMPLIADGNALIDVTYVENVVKSLILAAEVSPKCLGKKYNITNDEPILLKNLLQKIFIALEIEFIPRKVSLSFAYFMAEIMENFSKLSFYKYEPQLTRYSVGVLGLGQTLDISAAKNDLHYAPRISLDEGVSRFANWWKHNDPY